MPKAVGGVSGGGCWTPVDVQNQSIAVSIGSAVAGAIGAVEPTEADTNADALPGALHQGWEHYYEWANKDHEAWKEAFLQAECKRLEESRRWLSYYYDVYTKDNAWWKKLIMFSLNAIQLWALWKQFRQQKEIADRTYEIADRTQKIAEELYGFYEAVYKPQESALSSQIASYFSGRECVDYALADRFGQNTVSAFARSKANMLRCTGSHCGSFTPAMMKQFEIAAAQAVGNARTSAFRYAEMIKESKDALYLELRMKFIQVGRNVSADGQNGVMKAFGTFSSFGADPGAALNQLLGTFANMMGSQISAPVMQTGQMPQMPHQPYHIPYIPRVTQSGDVQVGKAAMTERIY